MPNRVNEFTTVSEDGTEIYITDGTGARAPRARRSDGPADRASSALTSTTSPARGAAA